MIHVVDTGGGETEKTSRWIDKGRAVIEPILKTWP